MNLPVGSPGLSSLIKAEGSVALDRAIGAMQGRITISMVFRFLGLVFFV